MPRIKQVLIWVNTSLFVPIFFHKNDKVVVNELNKLSLRDN